MVHIIPFKGKNTSWYKELNLLCKEDNVYIMDNHNAALWCWLQEIKSNKKYNLLHIDQHYDTRTSHLDQWLDSIPRDLPKLSIQNYLNLSYYDPNFGEEVKVMWWDNYFPIFDRLFGSQINEYHFFTHKQGSKYDAMWNRVSEYSPYAFTNFMKYLFSQEATDHDWIINIDIDYFVYKIEGSEDSFQLIDNEAIDYFINILNEFKDKIEVVTIALSPECSGGWDKALELTNHIATQLGIDFEIP